MKNSAFEVDIMGLRALQAGKPIWFVVRELIQNALDENITTCNVKFSYERGTATIIVEDDNPSGFRDLSDAYTLFKDTYKRGDVTKRGRFNFGEKQVIAMCDYAKIVTTTGGVEFTKNGRTKLRARKFSGSEVTAEIKMTKEDYQGCINYCNNILVPKKVNLEVWIGGKIAGSIDSRYDTKKVNYREPDHSFAAELQTEKIQDGVMRKLRRDTTISLHKRETVQEAFIYEMGIPVCAIDCDYHIDIAQKIPLNLERDNVDSKFLKEVYAHVLNHVFEEVKEEQASNSWVRTASASDKIEAAAVKNIFTKRYGGKAVIANPFDRKSIDEAITHGYNVIRSSELNGDEHQNAKKFGVLMTSSEAFPVTLTGYTQLEMTQDMKRIAQFIKRVFELESKKPLDVMFIESDATCLADFSPSGGGYQVRFNMSNIYPAWIILKQIPLTSEGYVMTVREELLDLIIHELSHVNGTHHEKSYLDTITRLGAKLSMLALTNPSFFNL